MHVGRDRLPAIAHCDHLQGARHRPPMIPVAVRQYHCANFPEIDAEPDHVALKHPFLGPGVEQERRLADPVRVVIKQESPCAAQQRHFPDSHCIPRRRWPANSVSTKPGFDERLSVALSTRKMTSAVSTALMEAAPPEDASGPLYPIRVPRIAPIGMRAPASPSTAPSAATRQPRRLLPLRRAMAAWSLQSPPEAPIRTIGTGSERPAARSGKRPGWTSTISVREHVLAPHLAAA